ncbi:unnamed protein product [Echinostoma caproni]|uniref:DUF7083 domain-containing protein n=1 Tax=Echinostoma caproni TaxID=27848 RepID=A0A183B9M6_9TREM|nr:unnamed protein product [Echinostoma caproni]
MLNTPEQIQEILKHQQAQFEAADPRMMETMLQRLSSHPNPARPVKQSTSIDAVAADITEFVYDPDAGTTFHSLLKRWEDVFRFEFADGDDRWKVRLLLQKLETKEQDRYTDTVMPKSPRHFTFEEKIQ